MKKTERVDEIFLLRDGEPQGPFPRDEVFQQFCTGELGADVLWAEDGSTEWSSIDQLKPPRPLVPRATQFRSAISPVWVLAVGIGGIIGLAGAVCSGSWSWLLGGQVISLIYCAPIFLAYEKRSRNLAAIIALDLLLGWTFIGWVAALIWALYKEPAR